MHNEEIGIIPYKSFKYYYFDIILQTCPIIILLVDNRIFGHILTDRLSSSLT